MGAEEAVKALCQDELHDRGFRETIRAIRTVETGDVARAAVHYSSQVPGDTRPPQQGIDLFLLLKQDGAWRIVSVVNEIVRPGVPVPEELRKQRGRVRTLTS